MNFYAHTHPDYPSPEQAAAHWEPLFTLFGKEENQCQREHCKKCEALEPRHGHLNKVAWWTARYASQMFAPGSASWSALALVSLLAIARVL